jgi:Bacterial DNA-binding protein
MRRAHIGKIEKPAAIRSRHKERGTPFHGICLVLVACLHSLASYRSWLVRCTEWAYQQTRESDPGMDATGESLDHQKDEPDVVDQPDGSSGGRLLGEGIIMLMRDLRDVLQNKGFSYRDSRKAVRAVFDIMKEHLARGESVEVPAGVLEVRTIKNRKKVRRLHKCRLNTPKRSRFIMYPLISKFPEKFIFFHRNLEFYE